MKRKYLLSFLYLVSSAVLATGCVATSGIPAVQSTSAHDVNLAAKSTYAWFQEKPLVGQGPKAPFNGTLDKHLRRAIEEQLQQKGLTKATENPDLLVAYDVSLSVPAEKDKPNLYAPGFGYSYAYEAGYRYNYGNSRLEGYRPVDLFKEGTLIIDVIDRESGQLIWRGWTEGAISDFNASYKKINNKVTPIMSSYPQQ